MVGHLSDHTRTRWGARRPWHLAGCVCVALSFPALLGACAPALRLEAVGPHWARSPQVLRIVTMTYYSLVRRARNMRPSVAAARPDADRSRR